MQLTYCVVLTSQYKMRLEQLTLLKCWLLAVQLSSICVNSAELPNI